MTDDIRRILDHIVRQFVVNDELRTIDRGAGNTPDGVAIETDKAQASRREVAHADDLAPAFEAGIVRAWERSRIGGHELLLDDRKPDQDLMADALIQFLVRFNVASSRTEETDPLHYRYYISVDWERMRTIAADVGLDLDTTLGQLAERFAR